MKKNSSLQRKSGVSSISYMIALVGILVAAAAVSVFVKPKSPSTITATPIPVPTARPTIVTFSTSDGSSQKQGLFPLETLAPTATPIPWNTPTPIAPTPTLPGGATPTVPAAGCTYPSQKLDLTNWKLTLPIGSGSPTEIQQPQLATYSIDPWFIVNPPCDGVRFRAHTSSPVTTSNSNYPRSELREMTNNGSNLASWSNTSGVHTMFIDEAITAVPTGKKHVVAGQIHDASNDVIVIRLEYPTLFVDINGVTGPTLDPAYTLGKRFNVKFVAANGVIDVYYNGSSTSSYTLNRSIINSYFKAGVYTQSNCSKEPQYGATCNDANYGEVVIYNVWVLHQ